MAHTPPPSLKQDIGRLLSLASTSLALLALPQTDAPDAGLPEGDERSEQFVAKVGEYFETLDVRLSCVPPPKKKKNIKIKRCCFWQGIQVALRSSLAHIRAARISPAVLIAAPPAGFVPPPQGVGLPQNSHSQERDHGASGGGRNVDAKEKTRGLLEERVERDAWHGVLDALTRLRDARRAEAEAEGRG